ncbi:hypothetical protein GCM10022403_040110 [Streptomyces coacervatus]|uniref:Secreted protein n=1 Tax=Streptomyces coacervatus TaxID=647381 RepID=A0ABP7HW73_9ACTN
MPAWVSQRRMTAAPTIAVAAAAAAMTRSTDCCENTHGPKAQTKETPAIADGGSSLCKGGEWR